MTYEQRLRQIAKEMARVTWGDLFKEPFESQDQTELIDSHLAYAEIAIRREGEAFDEGWTGALNMVCEPSAPDRDITKHDLGLIKPTTDGTEAR